MALTFKDLIKATKEYAEAESRTKVVESISSEDFKRLMKEAVLMGGDVNENIMKLYDEMRAQTAILEKSQKEDQVSVEKDKESVSVAKDQTNLLNDLIDTSQSIDNNVVKLQDEIRSQTKAIESGRKDATAIAEDKQEAEKADKEKTDIFKKIADNTDPSKQKKVNEDLGLGAIVTGITVALAGLAGAVAGYVKSIKVFLDVLTPKFIKDKVFNIFADIEKTFAAFAKKIKTVVAYAEFAIGVVFDEIANKFAKLFVFDEGSKIGKVVAGLKAGFSKLFAPFVEAFNAIKNLMAGTTKGLEFVGKISRSILGTVGDLKTWISKISGLFKGVFGIVSKLATPLFVIMTLWDTVSNVIDRFESDGIVGAFAGIFEGLFKSIVAAPLDLFKDIVSWVLGKFGFDEAEKFLDSFSFVDIVTGFFNAILRPIDTIVSMFEGVADLVDEYIIKPLTDAFAPIADFFVGIKDSIVGFFEAIEIPKIGFTIPIIDKEVSIGPFYPFKKEKPTEATVTGGETAAPAETTTKSAAPRKGSREEYDTVYKENLAKTRSNERVAQKLTATQVGLAPGASPDTLPRTAPAPASAVTQSTPATPGQVILASRESPEAKEDFDIEGARISYQPVYNKYIESGLTPIEAKAAADKETGLSPDVTSNIISTTNNVATVKASGISQNLYIPGTIVPNGTSIPQATGKETRAQTEERVRNALKAGVEEKQAEVRVIENGQQAIAPMSSVEPSTLEMSSFAKIQTKEISPLSTSVSIQTPAPTVNGESVSSSREEYYKEMGFTKEQVETLNARQAKIDAIRRQDPNVKIDKDLAIADAQSAALTKQAEANRTISPDKVEKQVQAYSSQMNIQNVLSQPERMNASQPTTAGVAANLVYAASAENADVATASPATTNNVVAPTTVNNTTNQVNNFKPDVRNQDSSFKRMLDNRYVPV